MKLLFILLSAGSFLLDHGASFADSVEVFAMEGDSVTLNTCFEKKKEEDIKWYFKATRIAQINGDINKICTDVQCNKGTERFRDRLKLDNQTGSLTITNTTDTDAGEYTLKISISSSDLTRKKTFNVNVYGVSAAEREKVKRKTVKKGESVTLDVKRNPNDSLMWYYNDFRITGDQRKIYTDNQCTERFRGRLKLDHQTGSLTIMNITDTHSGEYKLQNNHRSSRHRRSISNNNIEIFQVTVIADPGSGQSAGVVAGISVAVLLVFVATVAGVIYYHHSRSSRKDVEEQQPRASEEIPINQKEND